MFVLFSPFDIWSQTGEILHAKLQMYYIWEITAVIM